jgi:hypothetical protein
VATVASATTAPAALAEPNAALLQEHQLQEIVQSYPDVFTDEHRLKLIMKLSLWSKDPVLCCDLCLGTVHLKWKKWRNTFRSY